MVSVSALQTFIPTLWEYYDHHHRSLPWRQPNASGCFDAYKILVSEIMLQQTQVTRVIDKYQQFIKLFPGQKDLAAVSFAQVLSAWSGLGYNRRAQYLHEAAKKLPANTEWTLCDLTDCKGVGPNTAAAVLVYTYNQPHLFIETNVRTVYLHHFFEGQVNVADRDILPHLKATLDHQRPREFYWALMDYGAHLKKTVGNANRLSHHYTKQSKFEGSVRQLRGAVIKQMIAGPTDLFSLQRTLADPRLQQVIQALQDEGLIKTNKAMLYIA